MERTPTEHGQEVDAFLAEQYRRQADTYATFACYCWIGAGLYLFITDAALTLFSWQALAFFLPGLFFASGIIGGSFYLLGRLLAKITVKVANLDSPSALAITFMQTTSFAMMIGNLVVTFIVAKRVALFLGGL